MNTNKSEDIIDAQTDLIALQRSTISGQAETIASMKRAIEALQTLLRDAFSFLFGFLFAHGGLRSN